MPKSPSKRPVSATFHHTPRTSKRARTSNASEPPDFDDHEDDDFQLILQQIKEQEESEALALLLSKESYQTSTRSAGPSRAVNNDESALDDEALARRLAAEWAEEDRAPVPSSSSSSRPPHSEGNPSSGDNGITLSPDKHLSIYKDLFVGMRTCPKCRRSTPVNHAVLGFTSATIPPPKLPSLLHVPCTSCETNYCRGCSEAISCPMNCTQLHDCQALSHCAESRAIAIYETLSAFDRLILSERSSSDSRAQANLVSKKANSSSVGPGGTGYGADRGVYHDYSSSYDRRGRSRGLPPQTNTSRADQLASHFEDLVSRALQTLTYLLPSPYSDSPQPYDFLPHASVGPLISTSQLPEVLASLLRNDSVTDWTNRMTTYQAMLDLLRRMADCEVTLRRLIEPRWEVKKSCGIEDWMWGDGAIVWEKESNGGGIVRGTPLFGHFQKLTKQSEAFLAGAAQMLDDSAEDEEHDQMVMLTSLCGDIIAARDDIQRTMTSLGTLEDLEHASNAEPKAEPVMTPPVLPTRKGKGRGKAKAQPLAFDKEKALKLDQAYSRACESLSFKHVTLSDPGESGLVYSTFKYTNELNSSSNETRTPKDRIHLVKELAVMATSLPPGIWVRVDETRNDVLKILIAGPEGTPYAGGLFEFDCFMPLVYPQRPPLMHLRTTANGRVRFNPNLYACGKVCLSLLGTWAGRPEEQWLPYKSTLLQVLVSIQSMILIDLPWFNEPGRGRANPQNGHSTTYNRQLSVDTILWAILDWLEDTHRYGIWADVIATHFILRGERIREQIVEWAKKDPRIRACNERRPQGCAGSGPSSTSIDLLEEFDKKLENIKKWNLVSQV